MAGHDAGVSGRSWNWRRFLKCSSDAIKEKRLWKINDLTSTHAGKVIKLPQKQVDAYYSQLWSLVLFLKTTPRVSVGAATDADGCE